MNINLSLCLNNQNYDNYKYLKNNLSFSNLQRNCLAKSNSISFQKNIDVFSPTYAQDKNAQRYKKQMAALTLGVNQKPAEKEMTQAKNEFVKDYDFFLNASKSAETIAIKCSPQIKHNEIALDDTTKIYFDSKRELSDIGYVDVYTPSKIVNVNNDTKKSNLIDFKNMCQIKNMALDGAFGAHCDRVNFFSNKGFKNSLGDAFNFAMYLDAPLTLQSVVIKPSNRAINAHSMTIFENLGDDKVLIKTYISPEIEYLNSKMSSFRISAYSYCEKLIDKKGNIISRNFSKDYSETHNEYLTTKFSAKKYYELNKNHSAKCYFDYSQRLDGITGKQKDYSDCCDLWYEDC